MSIVRFARPTSLPPPGDRFVVVEASAGTGKTFFLEHRVADLILAGAELSQILLVTFTDKAVAELRLRIRDLLDRMARASESTAADEAWDLDDAARARLRAAVTAFDQASIFTIHGFCHRVLVEDAFAAHRLLEQAQVADEVAFEAAFTALLRERFAREAPDRDLLALYLERGNTVDRLRKLLLECARAGAMPRRRFDAARAGELADAIAARFTTAAARTAAAHGLGAREQGWVVGWLEDLVDVLARHAGHPARLLAACDEKRDQLPKLLGYLSKLPAQAESAALIREACATMTLDEALVGELLPQVLARGGSDKAERGLFDYDDMLALVRDALHGTRGGELAARLRARTPWVMIDEFQDTDPVQWDIFRTVWSAPGAADARGLTIVGDPKQAIYGFRGADVGTYLAARDELLRLGATRVVLEVNRRSTAPLVEALNELLAGGAPPLATPLLAGDITYDAPVRASGDIVAEGTRPPVSVLAIAAAGKDANRDALADAIGREIERLREAPPAWRVRGELRPFSLGQVLVLTRANRESDTIAAALRARGLPCALVEAERLFETREAAELASVLAAIAAPRDRSARLRALRTRFFDVPWHELMRAVDAPDHHPSIARLFDWAALANRRAYEALFRRLLEDSCFAERALVLGGGERALVNTRHLLELLLEEVACSRSDLHELVGRLNRWIAEGDQDHADDFDVQRVETDADAIRILTIHKAKGLEAPYVFLFGCGGAPPSRSVHTMRELAAGQHRRTLIVGKPDDATKKRVEAEADAENQRLAYVALTRAQVRLYLPRYGEGKAMDGKSMYAGIQRCLVPLASRAHPLFEVIDVTAGTDAAAGTPADALAGFDAPAPPALAELAPIAGVRGGLAMLSYTRLAHALDAPRATGGDLPLAIDASEFDVDDGQATGVPAGRAAAPGELPPGADSGLLLHDLFELADLATVRAAPDAAAWASVPEVRELLVARARARGIDEACLPHAARLVHATLTGPLQLAGGDALPPLAQAAALAREVEFTYPVPGQPVRALVRGFIDALVAWDDALWVLDYKSDLLDGADLARAAADRAAEHYAVQQRLYALAAARLRGTRPLAGLLFAFVRYGIAVAVPTTPEQLDAWARWLDTLPEVAR